MITAFDSVQWGLSSYEKSQLDTYDFDAAAFVQLQAQLAAGRFPPARNRVHATVEPMQPHEAIPGVETADPPDEQQRRAWQHVGAAALAAGQVAVVILNGGMATRFGGGVKGIVEVLPGRSFLALKLDDIRRRASPVPVFLMNSFATAAATHAHLAAHHHFGFPREHLCLFNQSISLRLCDSGALYRNRQGQVSFYAPGHGDLLGRLAAQPPLHQFIARGGKFLCISNVDNLGATLSRWVLGAHISASRPVTVEVVRRIDGDSGGAPASVNGRLQILEGFRFPADFDSRRLLYFNTNNFIINVELLQQDFPLTWFRADKKIDGDAVVQFERLLGEITAFADTTYLQVPRRGPHSRFLPVKTLADLDSLRPHLQQRLAGL